MAEPTDINKNKSTVSSMVDALRVELKELQSFKTVDPDVLGGKAGKSIPVPKKFTAEQTVAFMKQFPNMFPLANENAYFGIARALTAESPDLFDVSSFDAYEEKFGKTMEMQEKGASASKNITTAKTPKAANQPVADIDYNAKIRDGSITVREAFKAVLAKPKLSTSNTSSVKSLLSKVADEGIDLDARYFDVYDTEEFMEALDYSTNKTGVHRYKEFGAFETQLDGLVRLSKRNQPYKRISDNNKVKGLASSLGLTGTQIRGKDPMRGLVPSKAFDRIFHQALSEPESSEVDTKRGRDKVKVIDQQAADYLIYEKYTGQRLESNIGPDGLKISDFNFYTDKNGNTVVEVAEKVSGTKTRPAVVYSGEFAEFLRNKVETSKSLSPPDADLSKVNLFQTTVAATDKLWNDRIRPELEKEFRKQLPQGKGGSHSVVRKILARQLVQEFEMPRDAVKSWMGHAGAGINASGDILDESYTGAVPDKRVGELTNVLIRSDARNTPNVNNVNSLFVQRGAGFSQEVLFEIPETIELGENATLTESKAITRELSPGEVEDLSSQGFNRAARRDIATEKLRQQLGEIRSKAAQSAPKAQDVAPATVAEQYPDMDAKAEAKGVSRQNLVAKMLDRLGKGVKGAAFIELGRQVLDDPLDTAGELAKEIGLEGVARIAGLGVSSAAAVPMIMTPTKLASGELRPEDRPQDPAGPYAGQDFIPAREVEETDEDIMARVATQDSGMIPEPDRVPQAAPAQDQGFLSVN